MGTWLGGGRWGEFTGKGRWQKCCPIASTLHRSRSEIPLLFEGGGSRLSPWQLWRNKDLTKVWGKLSCGCPCVWPCHGQWLGIPAWRKDTGMVIQRGHSRNDSNKHCTTDWLLPTWVVFLNASLWMVNPARKAKRARVCACVSVKTERESERKEKGRRGWII